MYKNTKEKGITLVVLVITIILLLILAGLTISYITGGGLIDKTQVAMNEYEDADKKQQDIIDEINEKNKEEIDLEPVYSEEGAEDNIAPAELFEYEIINDGAVASSYMQNLPTKTARILGIKPEYCNSSGYNFIKDETDYYLEDTNYEIIYNGEKIQDILVIPYKVEIDGEMYTITEADLSIISRSDKYEAAYGASYPKVMKIVYPNTIKKMNIRNLEDGVDSPSQPMDIILSKNLSNIPDYAFYACCLRNIEIPDTVTTIGKGAFDNWYERYQIKEIIIPKSVKYIGNSSFNNWNEDQTIYFECSEEESKNWAQNWKGSWCEANIVWNYNSDETTE